MNKQLQAQTWPDTSCSCTRVSLLASARSAAAAEVVAAAAGAARPAAAAGAARPAAAAGAAAGAPARHFWVYALEGVTRLSVLQGQQLEHARLTRNLQQRLAQLTGHCHQFCLSGTATRWATGVFRGSLNGMNGMIASVASTAGWHAQDLLPHDGSSTAP
jgi:hypothetical protein